MSETPREAQQGVADAVRDLSDNTSVLVRHEIAAVQREMLDKAKQALPAIGLLGAAGFSGVLSAAAAYRLSVRLLEKSLPPATAALVAAAGYGAAAGAAGALGIKQLRADRPLVPAETVKAVADTAKAAAGTTAKAATGKTKAAAESAKTAADTTAKTARSKAKTAADTTARTATAARSRSRRQAAAPEQPDGSS